MFSGNKLLNIIGVRNYNGQKLLLVLLFNGNKNEDHRLVINYRVSKSELLFSL